MTTASVVKRAARIFFPWLAVTFLFWVVAGIIAGLMQEHLEILAFSVCGIIAAGIIWLSELK